MYIYMYIEVQKHASRFAYSSTMLFAFISVCMVVPTVCVHYDIHICIHVHICIST